MPAHVIVHLEQPRASRGTRIQESTSSDVTERLRRLAADHDGELSLNPPDPGTPLEAIATITVPDMDRANALADALRDLDGVEAAYSKPGEELP